MGTSPSSSLSLPTAPRTPDIFDLLARVGGGAPKGDIFDQLAAMQSVPAAKPQAGTGAGQRDLLDQIAEMQQRATGKAPAGKGDLLDQIAAQPQIRKPDVKGMIADPDFQKLGLADQRTALSALDPDFGKLNDAELVQAINGIRGQGDLLDQIAAVQQTSGNPSSAPHPTDPSLWERVNTGLIGPETLLKAATMLTPKPADMRPGESIMGYLTRVQNELNPNHPYVQALRTFLAGTTKDAYQTASGFTSPLSIALLGLGALGKLPGALGSLARAISLPSFTALGVKGATDAAGALDKPGNVATPEGARQYLTGMATAFGGAAGTGDALAGIKTNAGPFSPTNRTELTTLNISPTAGEELGPGAVRGIETTAAKTALVSGPISDLLRQRQEAIADRVAELQANITGPQAPTDVPARVQNEAAASLRSQRSAQQQANDLRALAVTGQPAISPAEAGALVKDAALGWADTLRGQESASYSAVERGAADRGITVPREGSERVALADQLLRESQAAEEAGKSPISASVAGTLKNLIGEPRIPDELQSIAKGEYGTSYEQLTPLQRSVVDNVGKQIGAEVQPPPAPTFAALKDARTAIQDEARTLRATGQSNTTTGALDKLSAAITSDMERSLSNHSDLLSEWQNARTLTAMRHAPFRENSLLGSFLREKNVVQGEDIVRQLLQRGNQSDAADLMNLIGGDVKAVGALRRAAADFVHSAPDASGALRLMEQRPGLRTILGNGFDRLRQSLEAQQTRELSPEELTYRTYLRSVTRAQRPEALFGQALASPTVADRLATLTGQQPRLHDYVGSEMLTAVLDRATANGTLGAEGSYLDPVRFSLEFRQAQPQLARFLPPQAMSELANFADTLGKLTLSYDVPLTQSGSIAAKFNALKLVGGTASVLGGLGSMLGHAFGHPYEGGAVGAGLGTLMSATAPSLFAWLSTRPWGAKLLSAMVKTQLGAPSFRSAGVAGAAQAEQQSR